MKYFVIDTLGDTEGDWCVIDSSPDDLGPTYYKPAKGKRIGDQYSDNVRIQTSTVHQEVRLGSLVGNTLKYLILEKAAKEVIQSHCAGVEIEYLPFTLCDHKNRIRSQDYFIVNPIGAVDCMNLAASEIQYLNKPGDAYHGTVVGVDKFVLDPKKLVAAPALFRVREDPRTYVISEPLADGLRSRGFTNVRLEELEQQEGH